MKPQRFSAFRSTNCKGGICCFELFEAYSLPCPKRFTMTQIQSLFAAFALAIVTPAVPFADKHEENKMMMKCAQVCSACQLECDSCFNHCLKMVTDGKTEHNATAQLCADCAECCKACATLCARNSPLSKHMLECCAKCCDQCATACEKTLTMSMVACGNHAAIVRRYAWKCQNTITSSFRSVMFLPTVDRRLPYGLNRTETTAAGVSSDSWWKAKDRHFLSSASRFAI